jgi:hypothetical protein
MRGLQQDARSLSLLRRRHGRALKGLVGGLMLVVAGYVVGQDAMQPKVQVDDSSFKCMLGVK